MKSKRVWLSVLAAVVVVAVAWVAMPERSKDSSAAAALVGEAVKQVLLDGDELTKMLDQPFTTTVHPPVYGGYDEMDDSAGSGECVGVVDVAPKALYRSGDVASYARETWVGAKTDGTDFKPLSTKVMFVKEAVVALPSAAEARAAFAKFSEQWRRCDGQPVNHGSDTPDEAGKPHLPGTEMHITDVRVTDTMLAASVVLDKNPKAPDTRAVGIQDNCLIGVLIAFTGAQHASGSADPETSSIDAVRAMQDKVAKLR